MNAIGRSSDIDPQDMLAEIRNLLVPSNKQTISDNNFSNDQIEKMLYESYQSAKHMKSKNEHQNERIALKLKNASQLLKKESFLVQNYTKEKIESDLFNHHRSYIKEEEKKYIEAQKNELIRIKQMQEKQQEERERKIIQTTKKYLNYETNAIPYNEINSLIHKDGLVSTEYLLKQKESGLHKSINNNISNDKSIDEMFEIQQKQRSQSQKNNPAQTLSRTKQLKQSKQYASMSQIQVIDHHEFDVNYQHKDDNQIVIEDNNQNYQEERKQNEQSKLQKTLMNCPNFMNVFKYFLQKQYTLLKYVEEQNRESIRERRSSVNRSQMPIKYQNYAQIYDKRNKKAVTLSKLSKQQNPKGIIIIPKQTVPRGNQSEVICTKVVSKMNGQSLNFHSKKLILNSNEIIYMAEDENDEQNGKKIQLVLQKVQVIKALKEEGGFLSKNQSQIQLVIVKGKTRNFKFQKLLLEGKEVYDELCKLMALKIYNLTTILSCNYNSNLYKFITNEKATTFDLSHEFIQPQEKYPTKQFRLMSIEIFASLFPLRSLVTDINLLECKLNALQIMVLIKSFSHLKKLKKITITQTKLTVQMLQILFSHIKELQQTNIQLRLPHCFIEDKTLDLIQTSFRAIYHKITVLDLSSNQISTKGMNKIAEWISQENCAITELILDNCPLLSLIRLGQLVKNAKKLQILSAENCGFSFDDKHQLKRFFVCCQSVKLKRLSLLKNQVVGDLQLLQSFWLHESPRELDVHLGIFSQNSSKNIQAKLCQKQ